MAVICSVVLFAFTCLVLVTDGISTSPPYLILTLLLLLVPVLSAVVLHRGGMANRVAVFGNLLLLGFCCWAIVAQHPHPEEGGVIPFTLLALFTPTINLLALLVGGKRKMHA